MMDQNRNTNRRIDGNKPKLRKRKLNTSAKIRIGLLVFFTVMFIFSVCMLIQQHSEYKQSEKDVEDARDVAGIPDMDVFDDFEFGDEWWDDYSDGDETGDVTGSDPANTGTPETGASTPDTTPTDPSDDVTAPPSPTETTKPNGSNSSSSGNKKDPYAEKLATADLNSLQKVNKDVIGWIYIVGTDISYPLLHAEDNEKYLRSSWRDADVYNRGGTIFMECLNKEDCTDFNTIIYGHRMTNETMFGKLKYYKKLDYWKKHPFVYILTDDGVVRYDIYSAYEISTDGQTYRIAFKDDKAKQDYIDFTVESSIIDTGIVPTVNDQILTLSTCSGNGYSTRWIVQAVRRG